MPLSSQKLTDLGLLAGVILKPKKCRDFAFKPMRGCLLRGLIAKDSLFNICKYFDIMYWDAEITKNSLPFMEMSRYLYLCTARKNPHVIEFLQTTILDDYPTKDVKKKI